MDGILLINKIEGVTSYDVIRKIKRYIPRNQKIGHAGTLDPFASGLLIILLGRATKLMDTFHTLNKEYEVVANFGFCTDTQDIEGDVIQRSDISKEISKEEIKEIIEKKYLGNINQIPPLYSAKKVNGQRAYDLAREGKEVVLKGKDIEILKFEEINRDWPKVTFSIICSTGTYIRTLIDDLGKDLDIFGTAVSLCRKSIGDFKLEDALDFSTIDEHILEKVIDIDKVKDIINYE